MPIEQWWSRLQPRTREWLIANNGDVMPRAILDEIAEVGGPAASAAWWVTDEGAAGPVMPDAAIDWIEEIANSEAPAER